MSIQKLFVAGVVTLFLIAGNSISSAQVKGINVPGPGERGLLCLNKWPPLTVKIDFVELSPIPTTPTKSAEVNAEVHLTVRQVVCMGPGVIPLVVAVSDCKTFPSISLLEKIIGPTDHPKTVNFTCKASALGCDAAGFTSAAVNASWSDFTTSTRMKVACPATS
ncbi:hypothetical protein [Variovorax ginsengisoli]|nr:hypothetical protein [Variovorax ginsengisoli]